MWKFDDQFNSHDDRIGKKEKHVSPYPCFVRISDRADLSFYSLRDYCADWNVPIFLSFEMASIQAADDIKYGENPRVYENERINIRIFKIFDYIWWNLIPQTKK